MVGRKKQSRLPWHVGGFAKTLVHAYNRKDLRDASNVEVKNPAQLEKHCLRQILFLLH